MSMYISYGAIVCRYKTANPDIFYHTTMYIFIRSFYKVVKNCKVEEQKKNDSFFVFFEFVDIIATHFYAFMNSYTVYWCTSTY